MTTAHGLRAFISGCKSLELSRREADFFRESRPCGIILFKRNCRDPEQVSRLVSDAKEAVGDDRILILIDQEGGRVQRLTAPAWRQYPAARRFAMLFERDADRGLEAARLGARLIARDLAALGINVNCAPVLDIPVPGAHDIIGDRAYGMSAQMVIQLGRAVAQGYLDGGVLPVIKHIPGHGRARVDSHAALPVIDGKRAELAETDFAPFRALRDMPLGMTAHILVPDIDPDRPSSASPGIIRDVIRGEIGFDGFLMCDDLGMGALSGDMAKRTSAVLQAGCDVALHCSGKLSEMEAVASAAPELSGEAARRFEAALSRIGEPQTFDETRAEALLAEVSACDPQDSAIS